MENYNAETLFAFMNGFRAVVTIGKRADDGDARSFEVFAKDLPLATLAHCLQYGIQRGINDKVGGSDKRLADKFAIAQQILLNWRSGKVRKNRIINEPTDPIEAEALREARVTIHALAKRGGAVWYKAVAEKLELPFDETENDMKEIRDEAITIRAKKPEMTAAATKIVEAKRNIRVSAADLGI